MVYETWADRQIREAMERGEFDNLPGAGKPIAGLTGRQDENWWLKNYLERERISMPLPPSLQLRKEIEELPDQLSCVRRESQVREIVEALNVRIASHRLRPDGPPVVIKDVDVDQAVVEWRARRSGS
ncbi:MAG: DUF1992 domain-containing protein [Propionibacteriaceae bacterium]